MAADASDEPSGRPTLKRTCHRCEEAVQSHVWYAQTVHDEDEDRPHRIYTCPSCYFELEDDERATYYRERV